MKYKDLHWLVGLLEGEGCFTVSKYKKYKYPMVKLKMTDEDVLARAAKLLNSAYHVSQKKAKNPNHKIAFETSITGSRAIELMKRIEPLMGARRRSRIQEVMLILGEDYHLKMERLGRIAKSEIGEQPTVLGRRERRWVWKTRNLAHA